MFIGEKPPTRNHNPCVGGSSPSSATIMRLSICCSFIFSGDAIRIEPLELWISWVRFDKLCPALV